MSSMSPVLIEADNVSHAWARAFLRIVDSPGTEIAPLLLSVNGFDGSEIAEDWSIRWPLDAALRAAGKVDTETAAFTIFPEPVWRLAGGNRHRLYQLYIAALPRYVAIDRRRNGRGLYFSRLVAYWVDPRTGSQLPHIPNGSLPENGNQLEYIIAQYLTREETRRSMFQAAVFDPGRDHVPAAQLGFPCMQHLSFVPFHDGTLAVNAFYATQQLFWKGYGNFLGLCRLGRFMAGEMGLRLGRMSCYIGIEKMEGFRKNLPASAAVIAAARSAVGDTSHGEQS